ncbi:MAG: hypothetical protein IBJ18_11405 [Phycisphaerales bacterium]|nr:hypothetical protein [Phycisphaerales bacterium]
MSGIARPTRGSARLRLNALARAVVLALMVVGAPDFASAEPGGTVAPTNVAKTKVAPLSAAETRELADLLRAMLDPQASPSAGEAARALRRLRDPALAPLFAQLSMVRDPVLSAEGVLGSAELSEAGSLDLLSVRTLSDPGARTRVIALGIEAGLLSTTQLEDLARWNELPPTVLLSLSAQLVSVGGILPRSNLEKLLSDDDPLRAVSAAVILASVGDSPVAVRSEAIIAEKQSELLMHQHAAGLSTLFEFAVRARLRASVPLAKYVYSHSGEDSVRMAALGVLTALAPADQQTVILLRDQLDARVELPERRRHALAILNAALRPSGRTAQTVVRAMISDADESISLMGRALRAHESPNEWSGESIRTLASLGEFDLSVWAILAASERSQTDRLLVAEAVVRSLKPDSAAGMQILAETMASEIIKTDSVRSAKLLMEALRDRNAPVQRAMLLGLIRAGVPGMQEDEAMVPALCGLVLGSEETASRAALSLCEIAMAMDAAGRLPWSPDTWPRPGRVSVTDPMIDASGSESESGTNVEELGEADRDELARRGERIRRSRQLAHLALERTDLPMGWRAQGAWLALRCAAEDRAGLARVLSTLAPLSDRPNSPSQR